MRKSIFFLLLSSICYSGYLLAEDMPIEQVSPEIAHDILRKRTDTYHHVNTNIQLSENNDQANIILYNDYLTENNEKQHINGNMIPVINLNDSDHDEVSHNYFSKLDIGKRQAALFNNRNISNPANVIIAEVTSSEKSYLEGRLGVLGKEASLIIANPMGIDCVSCSFRGANNVTLLAGKIERKVGDHIEFKKQLDKEVNMFGYMDLDNISHIDIYADKIFIHRNAIIKADKINFNIRDGIEHYTGRKYYRDRMRAPIIPTLSNNSVIDIKRDSEIYANDLKIDISNAHFINNGALYGKNNINIKISNYGDIRVGQNNGVISSDGDIYISPNKIINLGHGMTTAINKERRVYHYDLTGKSR